ncbi:MAG: response regulator [Acidobacteriota bacterium]|nr:response regulator [Acidobacteriota bacterium]
MAQRKLLLADDSITIQKVINLTFADEGISVTSVGNGLAAIEQLREVAPDLVLADVHMPGLTGYEVCEQIRKTPGFENIPVMLLVGSFEPFDEAEARRVGADDYLTKPFQSIKQLVSKVHSLLESSQVETGVQSQPETVSKEQSAAAGANFNFFDDKSAKDDLLQVNDGNFNFGDAAFDDEMIETTPVSPNFADTFEDLDILTPAPPSQEKSENEWRVVEPENQNRSEEFSAPLNEAPTVELDINEISSPAETNQWQSENENAIDWQIIEPAAQSEETAFDFLDTEDEVEQPQMAVQDERDSYLNARSENVLDAEPIINFAEQKPPEEKPVSPFADLFDDDDLLGIEDEIRAEIGDQNFQTQSSDESQSGSDEAITPEIVTPETESQSQELAPVKQSTAVEKSNEYASLNFPPEVIDAIAARVVEKLSDKVIEKIAWEIVPDRFDLIVRKTIQNKDRER